MDWAPDLAGFGWRDWLLVLILVTAVYMLVVFFRMRRVTHQHRKEQQPPLARRAVDEQREPALPPAERPAFAGRGIETLSDELARDPIAAVARGNADRAAIERLQRESAQLKEELDALRTSFAGVRDELRQEVAKLKAAQRVSPLYGDSMQMALAGASAEAISARCGIARAEAELVIALAHSRQGDETIGGGLGSEEGFGFPQAPEANGNVAREDNKSGRPKRLGPY
jgi:hypothetical protein